MPKSTQYNKIKIGNMSVSVRMISSALIAGVIFFALLYVYMLASTTMNVTMRKTMQNESRELQSQIADLEAEYLLGRSALTLEKALVYGFQESDNQSFVYRHKTSDSLALGIE